MTDTVVVGTLAVAGGSGYFIYNMAGKGNVGMVLGVVGGVLLGQMTSMLLDPVGKTRFPGPLKMLFG